MLLLRRLIVHDGPFFAPAGERAHAVSMKWESSEMKISELEKFFYFCFSSQSLEQILNKTF
jgi:hypothetical protein